MYTSEQPLKTTLKEFIETGMIGPITVGASIEEVHDCFGDPIRETAPYPKRGKNKHSVKAWAYGCLELGFANDVVDWLGFDYHGKKLPRNVVIEGYFPPTRTSLREFVSYLEREEISYQDYPPFTFSGLQTALIMGVGAIVVFHAEDRLIGTLYYFGRDKVTK